MRRLICAVVLRAVKDAQAGNEQAADAVAWLDHLGPTFDSLRKWEYGCTVGGVMSEKSEQRQDWTVNQLAKKAGVSASLIRLELAAGRIIGRKIGPGRRGVWLISHAQAQQWLENRKQ